MSEELPEGWAEASFAELVDPNAPIQYGILQPGPDLPGGVQYVRPTEIVNDEIQVAALRRTSPEIAAKYRRASLRPGDVILSIVGSIGKVALVPPSLDGANITQSSARLRPRAGVVESRYLAALLRSPIARSLYDEATLGTGVPRLNIGDIRAMRVPIAPLAEQRRIVEKVDALLAQVKAVRDRLVRLNTLFGLGGGASDTDKMTQAILAKAFRGELVRTEADLARAERRAYESAADLLERLRESNGHPTKKRRRNKIGTIASARDAG
jgi:type I restriction enzyme S subunit